MRATGEPGTYESTEPVPLYGTWKTLIRLHEGNSLTGLSVYLPADEAIPVEEVPARDGATREFIADHEILQREQLTAAPGVWGCRVRGRARAHRRVPGADRVGAAPARPRRGARRGRRCDGRAPAARPRRRHPASGGVVMSAVLLPLADHGNPVAALPFVAPMLLIVAALAFLVIRDRLRRRP